MSRALLDVNVLIALLDSNHVHHDRARAWFTADGPPCWASCAITQNGFVRVVSQPRYRNPRTVAEADELLGSKAVADVYLLGLAVRNGGATREVRQIRTARHGSGSDTGKPRGALAAGSARPGRIAKLRDSRPRC